MCKIHPTQFCVQGSSYGDRHPPATLHALCVICSSHIRVIMTAPNPTVLSPTT
jgi:hypothetical protein